VFLMVGTLGGGKGPAHACDASAHGVTNPFMVTAAFTIFFAIEPIFIRFPGVRAGGRPVDPVAH
jgi:hypothetical protein